MPEASVHEHGQTRTGKHDVDMPASKASVFEEPKPMSPERAAETEFRLGIGPVHPSHPRRYHWAGVETVTLQSGSATTHCARFTKTLAL